MAREIDPDAAPARELERTIELFGTKVRLLASGPEEPAEERTPEAAIDEVESMLEEMHARLTRFDPESELCVLNDSRQQTVSVSEYMVVAIEAALQAAERSEGLIDPVMVDDLVEAGYAESMVGREPAALEDALAHTTRRETARARPDHPWRQISVDAEVGSVSRPAGMRIDLGGIGKGLAADLAASRLDGFASWCADIGGDLRLGGTAGLEREVGITNPLSGELEIRFPLAQGAVATSGISRRVWQIDGTKTFSHHLLDPATGQPAWTGVIQATAVAGSAQEAETLAKMALLSGPEDGSEILTAGGGGLLVLDSGEFEVVGALSGRVRKGVDGARRSAMVTG